MANCPISQTNDGDADPIKDLENTTPAVCTAHADRKDHQQRQHTPPLGAAAAATGHVRRLLLQQHMQAAQHAQWRHQAPASVRPAAAQQGRGFITTPHSLLHLPTAFPHTPLTNSHTLKHTCSTQVGLELSRILTNLGVIEDFSVGQRLSRVRAHSRLWDPARTSIQRSADAAGYPAMFLTLHLSYDQHKPLWCRTPLAAAPHTRLPHNSSSASSPAVPLPDPANFSPPLGVNAPTPQAVKIISKPSVQRWMGVQDLLRARVNGRPGIFLLSTHQVRGEEEFLGGGGVQEVLVVLGVPGAGCPFITAHQVRPATRTWFPPQLVECVCTQGCPSCPVRSPLCHTTTHQGLLTDIDCELRGIGGTVLAHLALPMGHVVQLRGLLRRKHLAELQVVLPAGQSAAALDAETQRALVAAGRVPHVPLSQWDARAASVAGLAERVQQQVVPGQQLVSSIMAGVNRDHSAARAARAEGRQPDLQNPHELLLEAQDVLAKLQLREAAWQQRPDGSSSSSGGGWQDSQQDGDRQQDGDSGSRFGRSRGGGRSGSTRQGVGRQALFGERRQGGKGSHDTWQPDS